MISNKHRTTIAGALVIPALLLGACTQKKDAAASGPGAAASVTGQIIVSGSSTVAPISNLVREDFIAKNPKVDIVVDGPGTGDGFKLFCQGDTDISDASRPIKAEEVDACKAAGVEFIELKIGIDGLSVITPESNPLDCLSFADLYALAGTESEGFKKWIDAQPLAKELGSKTVFPKENLVITAPGTESGTYDSFVEIVLASAGKPRVEAGNVTKDEGGQARADYSSSPDDNAIIEGVAGEPGGLGWVGFAFADQADGVKLMPVAKEAGGDCVAPSTATIQDGTYPISRNLFIYVNKAKAEKSKALNAFVDFYLKGLTGFVEAADYIALDDSASTAKIWADRTAGTTER
ncbi:MAG: substrate-binding domain-containing protein [Aquihabitans sp.]